MERNFEDILDKYADLILTVGVNLQEGQRLRIGSITEMYRVPFEAAPLIRKIASKAYQMGASLVEVFWGDEQLKLIRYRHATTEALREYPSWIAGEIVSSSKRGDAKLYIWGENPYLLDCVDPTRIAILQRAQAKELEQASEINAQNPTNWCGVNYPTQEWATAAFPKLQTADAISTLWDYIINFCNLEAPDPIEYWREHNKALRSRAQHLTETQYKSLRITGPETDLSLDLPKGHIWFGGIETLPNGLEYSPNIPTEEVGTLPHIEGVNGYLLTTKPFTYQGISIEGMRLKFERGVVVNYSADTGEEMLGIILEIDKGASRLGEVALVPQSSPITQSQILFHAPLIDENASIHLALGSAYRFSLTNAAEMDKEEFMGAGGNSSTIHLDFMIGSEETNIDGVNEDGSTDCLMNKGEWAFDVK